MKILWHHNPHDNATLKMTEDEIDLFNADIQDAIDGVIEDWEGN